MIDAKQLREYVITPVLEHLHANSHAAVNLLLMTAAQESLGGRYLRQLGGGPAMGIYQMEPATHDDCWDNYLKYQATLQRKVHSFVLGNTPTARGMIGNLYYATAMARVKYLRDARALPDASDVRGLAEYYKRVYNTPLGAATVEEAIQAYSTYVRGV